MLESKHNYWNKKCWIFLTIYPFKEKVSYAAKTLNALLDDVDKIDDVLRKSKRQRKETSFRDDLYTYIVSIDPISYFEAISSFDGNFWKKATQTELDSLINNKT